MKIHKDRISSFSFLACASVFLALCPTACSGANPQGERSAQSKEDLSLLGIPIPSPTVTIGVGDASASLAPVDTVGSLLPAINVDPIKPVNDLLGNLSQPISIGVTGGGAQLGVTVPVQLPPLPDPLDGGINLIGP